MTAQIGMPVQYCNVDLLVCPGFVLDLSGATIHHILYFQSSSSQWKVSPVNPSRDDTQSTADTWTVVTFNGTVSGAVSIESGV